MVLPVSIEKLWGGVFVLLEIFNKFFMIGTKKLYIFDIYNLMSLEVSVHS